MLTGSFALGHCATPRLTRDIDIVASLSARDVDALLSAFSADFYIDAEAARSGIASECLFNRMHLESGSKVEIVVRKSSACCQC